VLDAMLPGQPVDLLGHSMGGNVAMIYAGVRPERVRRLINLEGFGMPESKPEQAPKRYAQWLDELKESQSLRNYGSVAEVAQRLRKTNPLLNEPRAAWLAPHWSRRADDGQWHILGDPAHKRTNPMLYQKAEVLECWKRIEAPVLWVEGDQTDVSKWWGNRYPREDFEARLQWLRQLERHVLSPAGHMLHHDQPEALARILDSFLNKP
jgi:pimeloyl-ACP methyl ester carboxylesterase